MSFTCRQLFGTNGIRGIVNKELTPQVAAKIGCAAGTFFQGAQLLVGFDARTSGPLLAGAVVAGLNSTGCDVFLSRMVPTPALQYAVRHHGLGGGIMITASHNPPEYNGIKVIWKDGIEISREQEIEIENVYFDEKIGFAEWRKLGGIHEIHGIIDEYVEAIKSQINFTEIKKKRFHVVVDAANSVGALAAPKLLEKLGCKVSMLNGNIDGTFPGRLPEPRPENLQQLTSTVESLKADLGVAFDGDADRSIFVDENGKVYMGDKTFALVEKYFLIENPREKVVTPVSSSSMIEDIADQYGGEIVWTKVGSVTVSKTMKKLKAKLGGEENGGIFYGPHQPVRDGLMSTALILNIMALTGEKLSKLLSELPEYFLGKETVKCEHELKEAVLAQLIQQAKGLKVNTLDGAKIQFEDKSAILIRPSGTEPVYRLYAEAKTSERVSHLLKEYVEKLEKIINELKG